MIHVLQVLGRTDMGGAENRVMDTFRHIDRDKIQFDFAIHTKDKCYFDDEIMSLGGKIYSIPRFRVYNYFSYKKAWKEFFTEHPEIKVVHGHMTSTAGIYLPIARKCGVPLTIAHARSAGVDPGMKGILTRMLRLGLSNRCVKSLACSKEAAESVFGQKAYEDGRVEIVHNTVRTSRFVLNNEARKRIRDEYGILDSTFVMGHVGRFHYAKNHEFLIDIFSEFIKNCDNAVLMMVGEGPEMSRIKEMVEQKNIADKVIFAGNHSNVEDYYQAFDYFVFPSRYEGLPGTIVEAQTSGLRSLISDSITREVGITNLVTYKSLSESPSEWAKDILNSMEYERTNHQKEMIEAGFDADDQTKFFTEMYLSAGK